jgi:hypothetical protein
MLRLDMSQLHADGIKLRSEYSPLRRRRVAAAGTVLMLVSLAVLDGTARLVVVVAAAALLVGDPLVHKRRDAVLPVAIGLAVAVALVIILGSV